MTFSRKCVYCVSNREVSQKMDSERDLGSLAKLCLLGIDLSQYKPANQIRIQHRRRHHLLHFRTEPTPFTGVTPLTAIRQPKFRQSTSGAVSTATNTGDGGSLGVFSHANSPLKKATSMYDIQNGGREMPRNSFAMARREIQEQRERSKVQ